MLFKKSKKTKEAVVEVKKKVEASDNIQNKLNVTIENIGRASYFDVVLRRIFKMTKSKKTKEVRLEVEKKVAASNIVQDKFNVTIKDIDRAAVTFLDSDKNILTVYFDVV